MAKTYMTPGVYVEEISTLPPSVAEVATAIPAFIGYTEQGGSSTGPVIERIDTLLEYETTFGGPKPASFKVTTGTEGANDQERIKSVGLEGGRNPEFLMHFSVSLHFMNGGGSCYIVSLGDYATGKPAKADYDTGLAALEKEDEPTILVLTDAVNLDQGDYHSVCQAALSQCGKLGDRFAVLDVQNGDDDASKFRGFSSDDFKYGAAYHPYLNTTLNLRYDESSTVTIDSEGGSIASAPEGSFGGITVRYQGAEPNPSVRVNLGAASDPVEFSQDGAALTIRGVRDKTAGDVGVAFGENPVDNALDFDVVVDQADAPMTNTAAAVSLSAGDTGGGVSLKSIESTKTALYHQIKAALSKQRATLPPSGAIAGIYARVDRQRGVWKAPGNVSVLGVTGPALKITQTDQDRLNVDPNAGKSINAIREFTGKGTLVWGARTLAGNDNEWRYVSVRRLFNMIEESSRKSTAFAVFEPNDATTWLKVKGMIESFLYGLWERGALAGPTPESAYFVDVGLGTTMTTDDILGGRMIVRIGVAAVRPAEFIILEFMHKLQEA